MCCLSYAISLQLLSAISQFYPHIISTEVSFYIDDRYKCGSRFLCVQWVHIICIFAVLMQRLLQQRENKASFADITAIIIIITILIIKTMFMVLSS